ncbi:MAG TPA: HNH endonuclease signature motif containing protein, partial [Candidatus Omnitrophota bacterium]|nr:HNH endonuclease signature motif containing protein [Candidatus Omnitrophota bacterium]
DANGYREDKINEGLFDIQMYGFTQYEKRDVIKKAMAIKDAFIEVMTQDRAFIESIERGTYDTQRVKLRTEKWLQRLRDIIGYPENDRRLYTFEEKKALYEAGKEVCYHCGGKIAFIEDAHVDHLERFSEGGKTTIKNGKISHRYCNLQKG